MVPNHPTVPSRPRPSNHAAGGRPSGAASLCPADAARRCGMHRGPRRLRTPLAAARPRPRRRSPAAAAASHAAQSSACRRRRCYAAAAAVAARPIPALTDESTVAVARDRVRGPGPRRPEGAVCVRRGRPARMRPLRVRGTPRLQSLPASLALPRRTPPPARRARLPQCSRVAVIARPGHAARVNVVRAEAGCCRTPAAAH